MAPRRSTRLRPQIPTSEDGAGIAPRRSPRLRSRIQASEDGAGVTCRRSPRLHPQIHSSDVGARVTRRRRTSPEASASLPDDDDMLREILLRLTPQPSSLPRASAVCKRWRGLVTDPKFHRQFYAQHRKPPLLGVFEHSHKGIAFIPILDPPDRIPPQRFSLGRHSDSYLLDCRHGRVLVKSMAPKELVVCDPITGRQCSLAVPPDFDMSLYGAVLCAAGDHGHVHGDCHSSPFKVVAVSVHTKYDRSFACVYCSETGLWGNPISVEARCEVMGVSSVLVGNCLYWSSSRDVIVKFDLDEHSLTVIREPPGTIHTEYDYRQIIKAEDGTLGFAILDYPCFQIWQRNLSGNGVATWVLWKTFKIHSILELPPQIDGQRKNIRGYDEDTGEIFIYVEPNVYMVQLKSRQSKRLLETHHFCYYHPFKSFYTPGTAIDGGSNRAESLNNTSDDCQV